MKKVFKITTLAFAATLSTISVATAAGVLCTNHFSQQNVDSINKQVYILDTVAPVSNDLSNTTGGGLVKPTLNNTPVASYEDNQQNNTNVKPTLNSTSTSSQTSTTPITMPVQSDNISNVTNQQTESSDSSSDSLSNLASFFNTQTMQSIFSKINARIYNSISSGNHFEITLRGTNGFNINSGYSLDDLYNTNIRLAKVVVPYTMKFNTYNGKLTGTAHAEYDYNKVEVEYLDDPKVIGDCRTIDQKFEYFDGASYCYNMYNKVNYRTIASNNNELTIGIDLPPVHNPEKKNQVISTHQEFGLRNNTIYHTSGYIIIPKNWSNSIYKLANSRMPIDFKELISYGIKTSLFGSNEESRISIMNEPLTRLMIINNDGNADNDPINHWNDSWNQIIKDKANSISNKK